MSVSKEQIEAALAGIIDPHAERDLASMGAIRAVAVSDNRAVVDVQLPYFAAQWTADLPEIVREHLRGLALDALTVTVQTRVASYRVQKELSPLAQVKNIIAIASGKGGVGKSTTAANLSLALHAEGARVGLLDADIYGPSQPRMMGVSGKPESRDGKTIEPQTGHGVQVQSIGFMVEEDTPMIWRGPMVTQALQQLLNDTNWQDLDYLIIDLPPGTGDIQLTLCQRVPVAAAIIVTTPQDIALLDAKKALKMFEKVEVPVLGIIENMSLHTCSQCGHSEPIFGTGGAIRMSAQYQVPVLGQLPLSMAIREAADGGAPSVVAQPDSVEANQYRLIARKLGARLALGARNKKLAFPNIVIQNA
jgi:ATP-binding protein involved in chromosome partitioning